MMHHSKTVIGMLAVAGGILLTCSLALGLAGAPQSGARPVAEHATPQAPRPVVVPAQNPFAQTDADLTSVPYRSIYAEVGSYDAAVERSGTKPTGPSPGSWTRFPSIRASRYGSCSEIRVSCRGPITTQPSTRWVQRTIPGPLSDERSAAHRRACSMNTTCRWCRPTSLRLRQPVPRSTWSAGGSMA